MHPEFAALLEIARQHAAAGRFADMTALCRQLTQAPVTGNELLIEVGNLFAAQGFLMQARHCYLRARQIEPENLGILGNLANLAQSAGQHSSARRLYHELLQQRPDDAVIRRNLLTSLEYDPAASDAERLAAARAWGDWAIARAGGNRPRPACRPRHARPLRIGYVSADFCQHTVGFFVQDVLKAHDPARVQVFAYSAGQVQDSITEGIRAACQFRAVRTLNDQALATQIRHDEIDVLIDLSGHTAGSRLTVFAHRPAPVLVSWLGYFATTGLPVMDAVLLDAWHAPPGTEAQFVESIVRLPGRFCYTAVPWMPRVTLPDENRPFITFGSFNNTAKLNDAVLEIWAQILAAVPASRLVLKWRTFHDDTFRQTVTAIFEQYGIDAGRIELRGPSFHETMLEEYAGIDIALDPFPFTGGLTSCEALFMGVPVVSWPQSRVVSRQSHALLHQIGLPELSAGDAAEYVQIATRLANDRTRLKQLRTTLRERMLASPLMDVASHTRQLEDALIGLYRDIPRGSEST